MLTILSDILITANDRQVTLLAMLDLSAAFDCVDHNILLSRLQSTFGLDGNVLAWIWPFLTDRTQHVSFSSLLSSTINLLYGMPEVSSRSLAVPAIHD